VGNNNPAANLKQEDFQLFDQGKLQPISLFSMETRETRRAQAAAATETQVAEAEPIKSGNTVPPDRFIALMFDDSHISLDDATYFRQVAPRFLDGVIPSWGAGRALVGEDFNEKKLDVDACCEWDCGFLSFGARASAA